MSDAPRPLSPDDFFADPILVLVELDAVRRRPQMYVGATDDGTGLHNLVFAVVDDGLDQALAARVSVTLNADGSVGVSDDGRGAPPDIDTPKGLSAFEKHLTTLSRRPTATSGTHATAPTLGQTAGIGLAVVNALSQRFGLRMWRNGHAYAIDFFHGDPIAPFRRIEDSTGRHGRDVTFLPAAGSFPRIGFDHDVLRVGLSDRMRRRPGLNLTLVDERAAPA